MWDDTNTGKIFLYTAFLLSVKSLPSPLPLQQIKEGNLSPLKRRRGFFEVIDG